MTTILLLLIIYLVPLAMALIGLSASESARRPRSPERLRNPPLEPESTGLDTVEVDVLNVECVKEASRANQGLLKQAVTFAEQNLIFGSYRTAELLARNLNRSGVSALGFDIDVGSSSIEDLLALFPRFCELNSDRDIVLISVKRNEQPKLVRESYLVVAISQRLPLYPVLQSILGRAWRQQALASAISRLKPCTKEDALRVTLPSLAAHASVSA